MPKNGHLSNFFFLGNIGQENVFYNVEERENAFLSYKTEEGQKVKKMDNFHNGWTHGFGPKMAIFPRVFFLGNIGQENVFSGTLEKKNVFLG